MAQSTNVAKYDVGLYALVEAVCETEQPVVVAYTDAKKAKAARFSFYGLIRALYISGHTLGMKAQRIKVSLSGVNPKAPNILTLSLSATTDETDFYLAVAEKHLKEHGRGDSDD